MSDLVEFLRARLDEDQRIAEALAGATRMMGGKPDFTGQGGPAAEAFWSHVTPARALAEVDAKRETIRLYEEASAFVEMMKEHGQDAPAHVGAAEAYLNVIRNDAAVYADHPDYRDEWRP